MVFSLGWWYEHLRLSRFNQSDEHTRSMQSMWVTLQTLGAWCLSIVLSMSSLSQGNDVLSWHMMDDDVCMYRYMPLSLSHTHAYTTCMHAYMYIGDYWPCDHTITMLASLFGSFAYAGKRLHTYRHTQIHTYTHKCMNTYMHTHLHRHIQTYTHT